MKNHRTSNGITHSSFALALALTLAFWSPVRAQSTAPADGGMMTAGTQAERHQTMQEQREKILADMKAQDAELTAQLARINSAPEKQKMELLVAVVARMVEQRTAMHARMGEMMNQMMDDMPMEHGAMTSRPMMKGRDGMHTPSTGTAEKQK